MNRELLSSRSVFAFTSGCSGKARVLLLTFLDYDASPNIVTSVNNSILRYVISYYVGRYTRLFSRRF